MATQPQQQQLLVEQNNNNNNNNGEDDCVGYGYVLYVDHQGHPVPIDESYHATASRRLSSSIINRGYPSTINTVDSAYCPQCLSVYTEIGSTTNSSSSFSNSSSHSTANNSSNNNNNNNNGGYFCTKPTCKLCPVCSSIAPVRIVVITNTNEDSTTTTTTNTTYLVYGCSNCNWSSDMCNIRVPIDIDIDTTDTNTKMMSSISPELIGRVEMTRAINDLHMEYIQTKRIMNEIYDQYWIQLTTGWAEEARNTRSNNYTMYSSKNHTNNTSSNTTSRYTYTSPRRSNRNNTNNNNRTTSRNEQQQQYYDNNVWSMEALEAKIAEKKYMLIPKNFVVTDNDYDNDNDPSEKKEDTMLSITNESAATTIQRKGLQIQRITSKSISKVAQEILSTSTTKSTSVLDKSLASIPFVSYHQQVINTPFIQDTYKSTTTNNNNNSINILDYIITMIPQLLPLRLRTSTRCRMELYEGRPGILLKPKLNPLEGDSSLRTGQGQWFKKDCSAITIIPRVDIIYKHTTSTTGTSTSANNNNDNNDTITIFLLKVSNPTLGTVRIRFTQSNYCGEATIFNHDDNTNDTVNGTSITTDLDELIVDTVGGTGTSSSFSFESIGIEQQSTITSTTTIVNAKLYPLQNLITSETVELLSAEDSIIELGASRAREIPKQVLEWKLQQQQQQQESNRTVHTTTTTGTSTSSSSSSGSGSTTTTGQIKLISQSASDAWFELAIKSDHHHQQQQLQQRRAAFPIAIQVDLGNGSWESSLIPPDPTTAGTGTSNDYVSFDIVLVC